MSTATADTCTTTAPALTPRHHPPRSVGSVGSLGSLGSKRLRGGTLTAFLVSTFAFSSVGLAATEKAATPATSTEVPADAGATDGAEPGPDAVVEAKGPILDFEKYTLDNGLEVILHKDPRQPQVTVNVWYHVGAFNEVQGKSGFAHLFEHLMFQGSKHIPGDQHFRQLEAAGAAVVNGTTNFDRTNYFETLPKNELELGLWLESDRMGWLMETMSQSLLDEQRGVVKNERRQRIESRPYGVAQEKLWQAVFPPTHPYFGRVIGSMADLDAASLKDVATFYDEYYAPSNATLCVAGDIDVEATKALINKYFKTLPGWKKPAAPNTFSPTLTSVVRVDHEETIGVLPYIQIMWLVPARNQPGDVDLEVLASVLGDGVASRLQQALMMATEQAQNVSVEMDALANVGVFSIEATVRDGIDPQLVVDTIQAQLAYLQEIPIQPEEVERAKKKIRTARTFALEMGFVRADTLQEFNHYDGDPGGLSRYLERLDAVTDVTVMAAMTQHLNLEHRAVLVARPAGSVPPASDAADATEVSP